MIPDVSQTHHEAPQPARSDRIRCWLGIFETSHIDGNSCGQDWKAKLAWGRLLLLLSLPLFAQFGGAYELFPRPGWVDPMIYVGYFLDAAGQIRNYGPYYFSQRVPVIALGSLSYKFLSPAYAHLALGIVFQIIALISLFVIGKKAGGPLAGVFTGWWLGTNPLWIASATSGYIDAPAIAFALASIALLIHGTDLRNRVSSLLANAGSGFMFACVLALHPVPALLTAVALLLALVLLPSISSNLVRMLSMVAGCLFGLSAMAVYSYAIGGPFLFLLHDSAPIRNAIAGNALPFVRPTSDWLPGAFRLGTPFILLALATILLVRTGKGEAVARKHLFSMGLLTLLATSVFIGIWDLLLQGLMAQTWFYASYLLIGQGLLVAFIFGTLLAKRETSVRRDLAALIAYGIIIAGTLSVHETIESFADYDGTMVTWIGISLLAASLVLVAMIGMVRTALVGLALLTSIVGIANSDTRFAFTLPGTVPFRKFFELSLDIRRTAASTRLQGRRVALWVDRNNFTTGDAKSDEHATYSFFVRGKKLSLNSFDSLAGLWLWDKGVINFEMPTVFPENRQWLERAQIPTSLILVCTTTETCGQGHLQLDALKIPTQIRSRTIIWEEGLQPITVLIVDYIIESSKQN